MKPSGSSTKTSTRTVLDPRSLGVSQRLFSGSPRKNGAPSTVRPTTPPRSHSLVAPSARSYHCAAAVASGTASISEITGPRECDAIVGLLRSLSAQPGVHRLAAAARAVVAGLAEKSHSISKVVIANRDVERAKELAKIGSGLGLKCETISLDKAQSISPDSDLVVNATTLGINNEPSVIDYDHIKKGSIVYDIVYRPVTTSLIENAKYAEANVVYGYEMLVEQGAKAFEIWTGIQAPRDVMKKNLLGMFGETS